MNTISEEQVLHNELSFEINQELIHLMKQIIEMQKQNTELKEENFKLQARSDRVINNWNKLKEWLEDKNNQQYSKYIYNYSINNWVLNKMQEIEGGMNE